MKIKNTLIKYGISLLFIVFFSQANAKSLISGVDNNPSLSLKNQQKSALTTKKQVETNYITEDGINKKLKYEDNIVYFDFDKFNLKKQAIMTLNKHANYLKTNAHYQVLIEGHADERGTEEYNLALGARRAQAIKDYLIKQGVSPAQLYTISYGKNKLASLSKDENSHAKNRRGVLVY